MIKEDPVTLAQYAEKTNLLKTDQWYQLQPYHKKKFIMNLITKELLDSKKKVKFKFGVQVPNDYLQAVDLDMKNVNNEWVL